MADSYASVAVPAPAMGRTGSAASASLGQRVSAAEGAGRAQAAHRTLAAREARPIERAGRCGAEQGDASRAVAARSTAATTPSAIAGRRTDDQLKRFTSRMAPRVLYYMDEDIAIHSSPEASLLKPHINR